MPTPRDLELSCRGGEVIAFPVEDIEQVTSEDLLLRPPVQTLRRSVPAADVEVRVGHDHSIGQLAVDAGDEVTEASGRIGRDEELHPTGAPAFPRDRRRPHLDDDLGAVQPLERHHLGSARPSCAGHLQTLDGGVVRHTRHQVEQVLAEDLVLFRVAEDVHGGGVGGHDATLHMDHGPRPERLRVVLACVARAR